MYLLKKIVGLLYILSDTIVQIMAKKQLYMFVFIKLTRVDYVK